MAASQGGRGATFGGGPGYGRQGPPIWREPGSRKPIEAVEVLIKAGADAYFVKGTELQSLVDYLLDLHRALAAPAAPPRDKHGVSLAFEYGESDNTYRVEQFMPAGMITSIRIINGKT